MLFAGFPCVLPPSKNHSPCRPVTLKIVWYLFGGKTITSRKQGVLRHSCAMMPFGAGMYIQETPLVRRIVEQSFRACCLVAPHSIPITPQGGKILRRLSARRQLMTVARKHPYSGTAVVVTATPARDTGVLEMWLEACVIMCLEDRSATQPGQLTRVKAYYSFVYYAFCETCHQKRRSTGLSKDLLSIILTRLSFRLKTLSNLMLTKLWTSSLYMRKRGGAAAAAVLWVEDKSARYAISK